MALAAFIIHLDITKHKEIEEILRQSEERFALAVRYSNDGIWDHNMVNNTLYWSPRLFELYGFDPNEPDSSFDKYESRIHPDDEAQVKRVGDDRSSAQALARAEGLS